MARVRCCNFLEFLDLRYRRLLDLESCSALRLLRYLPHLLLCTQVLDAS